MLRKSFVLFIVIFGAALGFLSVDSRAESPDANGAERRARLQIIRELKKTYPNARIELTGPIAWSNTTGPEKFDRITLSEDSGRGDTHVIARQGGGDTVEGNVQFAAYVPGFLALRRIYPGERLSKEYFTTQEVNVASGLAHESRGMILPLSTDISTLETRQTILEGQFAQNTQVQRVPDIRRGDIVRLELVSGEVTLSTMGVASEPAYTGGLLKVTTQKNKRELAGILTREGTVQVKL